MEVPTKVLWRLVHGVLLDQNRSNDPASFFHVTLCASPLSSLSTLGSLCLTNLKPGFLNFSMGEVLDLIKDNLMAKKGELWWQRRGAACES